MVKETSLLGIPTKVWIVFGFLGATIALLLICALVVLMFGVDIGTVVG